MLLKRAMARKKRAVKTCENEHSDSDWNSQDFEEVRVLLVAFVPRRVFLFFWGETHHVFVWVFMPKL